MTKLTKISTNLIADEVYHQLKKAILGNELKPGEKLNIHSLAENFNVSRSPVKEAINRLSYEGLILIKPRKGTFVAGINEEIIKKTLEAREFFELWAVQKAVKTITPKDIQVLVNLCNEMDSIYENKEFDFIRYNELDIKFHKYLIKMGNNSRMMEFYQSLNAHWLTARGYFQFGTEPLIGKNEHHHMMVEAFRQKDIDALQDLTKGHIAQTVEDMIDLFGN